MRYDQEKVDEMTLALMYLVLHGGKWGMRAWKGLRLGPAGPAVREGIDRGSEEQGKVGAGHGGGDRALREVLLGAFWGG
jgi:hypothetical protein